MQILVAIDPGDRAYGPVLDAARRLSHDEDELHFLHVLPPPIEWYSDPMVTPEERTVETRRHIAAEIADKLRPRDIDEAAITVILGQSANVGNDIVDFAEKAGADIILLGTHGRTIRRGLFVGSVAERVVRFAHCDVHVVRASKELEEPVVGG